MTPTGVRPIERVHTGFYESFQSIEGKIKKDLEKNAGPPLYTTGHSLGGALAILATRYTAKDSLGACYTFGGPRVGNDKLDDIMFTPIYRMVHGADIVARVPPSRWWFRIFFLLIGVIPVYRSYIRAAIHWLNKNFGGYVHIGDMRYISITEANDPGLEIHTNPHLIARLWWVLPRWWGTLLRAGIGDHSMSLYRRKLRQYAITRAQTARAEPEVGEDITSPDVSDTPENPDAPST